MPDPTPKTLVAYCERLSARAGEGVRVMVSDPLETRCEVDLVRLLGDPRDAGTTGGEEAEAPEVEGFGFRGNEQQIRPGSYAEIPARGPLASLGGLRVELDLWPTRPREGEQVLIGNWSEEDSRGFALLLDSDGAAALRVGDGPERTADVSTGVPLAPRRWVTLRASYDGASGRLSLEQLPHRSTSPGSDLSAPPARVSRQGAPELLQPSTRSLLLAAAHGPDGHPSRHFDGKLARPRLSASAGGEAFEIRWDLSRDIDSDRIRDLGRHRLDGRCLQVPTRAVPGPDWQGEQRSWRDAPQLYDAIHFHSDDLADADWSASGELALPPELASGVYAVRIRSEDGRTDRTPLFVLPPRGSSRPPLALLMPTASYLAYANHRMYRWLRERLGGRARIRDEQRYLDAHPEVGLSLYEYHADHSGVMYSSRLRPILNLRPGADGWGFGADLALVAFLAHLGIEYDVITDEDLHLEGAPLLAPYRVVMTGTHPEYWSTDMLDGLEAWQRSGGRLMYLGGNGFYWRVAFSAHAPGVMEVRRSEDGTRAWIAEPGESYHSFTGEYGGLWRRLGRPPNHLVGVGFAAQGFDRGSYYRRSAACRDPRAAWILEGVENEVIGEYGVGGGAAGEEIDRYDARLGSPPHALVLASSEAHSPLMLRTKEELHSTVPPREEPDPEVRSDLVFFETPGGGAMFSTGSISWAGALSHKGYQNDIARITVNVLQRFMDETPFTLPDGAADPLEG